MEKPLKQPMLTDYFIQQYVSRTSRLFRTVEKEIDHTTDYKTIDMPQHIRLIRQN